MCIIICLCRFICVAADLNIYTTVNKPFSLSWIQERLFVACCSIECVLLYIYVYEYIICMSLQVLQAQLESLLQGQEGIRSSCSFTEQALNHGSEAEVLLVKKQMSERLDELANQELPLRPEENNQLDFLVETDGLRKSIHNLGAIVTTNAVAAETVATGESLRHCIVGQPTSVTITTKDRDGGLCRTGNALLIADLSASDGTIVGGGEVTDHKNGTYEFVYTAPCEGRFTLSLKLYDQHIKGSPFSIRANKMMDISLTADGGKKRLKSPGSSHVKQRAIKRPASMYSTGKRKENPIEDDLMFRIGMMGTRSFCLNPILTDCIRNNHYYSQVTVKGECFY